MMRKSIPGVVSILLFWSTSATPAESNAASVESSVVKVSSTVRYPDWCKPWTKQAPREIFGSGIVIEGKRILSNAHLATYASQIQVQANESGDKISCRVEAIAPDIDLAVLKLDDESFFDKHPPLPRAKTLPAIKDAVLAYGYPEGGVSLSITRGIISRIEFSPYSFPVCGLMIQVDAAINPGNSGGPVMAGDKMIGLAFRLLSNSDGVGYIIPNEEIDLFLEDIKDGDYDGKPIMFDRTQTLENPALRAFLKLDKSVMGTVVHQPQCTNAAYPLKEWDLITRIGNTPVDNQERVSLGDGLRVHYKYLVQKEAKNGKLPVTLVRSGKELQIELPVPSRVPTVVPLCGQEYPSYFVCGPMVFTAASREVMLAMACTELGGGLLLRLATVGSPLIKRLGDEQHFPGENLVIISSPFFPTKLVTGYDNPTFQVVKTVNGHRIGNLASLVETIRDCRDEFIAIEFELLGAETLVFSRNELLAATNDILTDNGVRSQGSPDMLAIWNMRGN